MKTQSNWEKELRELIYAYNRGGNGNELKIFAIEERMVKKLISFVRSLLRKV
jgi:hypothetical protein